VVFVVRFERIAIKYQLIKGPPPMGEKKKPYRRRLKKMEDVRRFLADTVNKLNRDEIEINKASKLGYLLQIMARVIEGSNLEQRVTELEKALISKGD
jgi:hypothetical protein